MARKETVEIECDRCGETHELTDEIQASWSRVIITPLNATKVKRSDTKELCEDCTKIIQDEIEEEEIVDDRRA